MKYNIRKKTGLGVFFSWLNKSLLPYYHPWVWEDRPLSFEEKESLFPFWIECKLYPYNWIVYLGKSL